MPQYAVDTRYGLRYIDFAYPHAKIAIELDSRSDHGTRITFEEDRVRQDDLHLLGWNSSFVSLGDR